jgi:hypothetical protein
MSLFSRWIKATASTLKTVMNVGADYARTVVGLVREGLGKIKEKWGNLDVQKLKEQRFDEIRTINDEILELTTKFRRDGGLKESDAERLRQLIEKRNQNKEKIDNAKEVLIAEDIVDNGHEYKHKLVLAENPNELTRLVGQFVTGKKCRRCGRAMSIRYKTGILNPTATDFFWGCAGFFTFNEAGLRECNSWEPLTAEDRSIFARTTNQGLELPSDRLNDLVQKPIVAQEIISRLSDGLDEGSDQYICPIHFEKMELKKRQDAKGGLLDTFYLKCPRCEQMVKIKSVPQLDAVLEIYTDHGLF